MVNARTRLVLEANKPAPAAYYQNNCTALLEFVLERYHGYLNDKQRLQIDAYLGATSHAQRLFARLLTRKGPYFRVDRLQYAEVSNSTAALGELEACGLIHSRPSGPADQLLNLLRKDELVALAPGSGVRKKSELILQLLDMTPDAVVRRRIQQDWVGIADPEHWQFMLFLYFGDMRSDWSTFVLEDLGQVRYEELITHSRKYPDLGALQADLQCREWSRLTHHLDAMPALADALSKVLGGLQASRWVNERRERALLRIAQWQERQQALPSALATYALVRQHPARERSVRALKRLGWQAQEAQLLRAIKRNPWTDEERQFAERWRQRGRGFQPDVLTLQTPQIAGHLSIEQHALQVLHGHTPLRWGVHGENRLVKTLTGLRYWSVIFADVPGAFTNPFQTLPNDFYFADFCAARREEIAAVEAATDDEYSLLEHLKTVCENKQGVANGLVSWDLFNQVSIDELLAGLSFETIDALTRLLIRNLKSRRVGFPDLLVRYADGRAEFLEVKGPNDQLQPQQRVWFEHLAALEVPARVLKIVVA